MQKILPQGGLEVPCLLMFTGDTSLVEKATSLIAKTEAQGSVKNEGSIKDKVIVVDVRPQKMATAYGSNLVALASQHLTRSMF